jgi:hypothetical protein
VGIYSNISSGLCPAGRSALYVEVGVASETLNQIATTYKTTVDAIISWNRSSDLSVIHPGDQIKIFLGNR